MAQALESPRFFCHECHDEVQLDPQTKACVRCESGFVEEIENNAPPGSASATTRRRHAAAAEPPGDPAAAFAEMLANGLLHGLRGEGSSSTPPPTHSYNTRQASRQQASMDTGLVEGDDMAGVAVAPSPNVHIHFNSGPGDRAMNFTGIMNYVLQRLSTDLGGGVGGGGGQFLQIHGNPGDYAWGAAGLDTIITQLFNQIDPGSGAPPADEATINRLPEVAVQQSHVDAGAQCAICMDDYELAQKVRKLPCGHMYHLDCIKKWLEMHGTCPVCRKDMNGKLPDTGSGDDTAMNLLNVAGSSIS